MHVALLIPSVPGHLFPALPLAEESVRRGHRVSFTTSEPMVPTVRASGAEPVVLPGAPPGAWTSGPDFTAEQLAAMLEEVLSNARVTFPLMEEHSRANRPDVVCFDAIDPIGRMLADKLGVPHAALVPNLASDEHHTFSGTFIPECFDFGNPRFQRVTREMQEFAEQHGFDGMRNPMTEVLSDHNIVLVPREFQPDGENFDERFFFVGPSFGSREHAESWQPHDSEAPLIYISLGTVFNDRPEFFRTCLDAFRDGQWQVAMSVGDQVRPEDLGDAPPNIGIRQRFPQLAVLRHANAFVTHAGMNSTMEALSLGVPTVAVPQVPEQRTNARRVEQLGLGRHLNDDDPTADTLRAAVEDVVQDGDMRAQLTRMRHSIRDTGGARAAAGVLERIGSNAPS